MNNNDSFNNMVNQNFNVTQNNMDNPTINLNNNTTLNNNVINQNYNGIQNGNGANINYGNKLNNKNKKIIILIILILIVLIGVFVFFNFFRNSDSTVDLNSIFDPNKPIVVKNNDKYGYITSEGKMMIEPQYKSADDFYGDYAVVSIDNPDTNAYNKTIYQLIDKKGNVKLTSDYLEPEYYSDYDLWVVNGVLYDSNLNKMLSEGITVNYIDYEYFEYSDRVKKESGIMTYNGKKIFTVPCVSISAEISENDYNKDDLYASVKTYCDPKKEMVISLKTGDVLFTSEDAEKYYLFSSDNGIFSYYNHTLDDGKKNVKYLFFINNNLAYQTVEGVYDLDVYDYQNQIIEIDYGYDYELFGKTKRKYYYDAKNKKMLEERPSLSTTTDLELNLMELTYGFKEYSSSGKYGLMSGEKVIVPCEYNNIEYLNIDLFNYMKLKGKELVLLEKDDTLVLYDLKNSKTITTFNARVVNDYDESTFIKLSLYAEGNYTITGYIIYNLLSNKSMDFAANSEIEIGSNYIAIKKDGKNTYYNTDFKQIYIATE